jgi:hypothetical protein
LKNQLRLIDDDLLNATRRLFVVGDLHGDATSLGRVLSYWNPSEDLLLFIGDYSDRGEQSTEVVERVDRLLSQYPDRVIGLKGNHEDYTEEGEPYFSPCSLVDDATAKWGSWQRFQEIVYRPFLQKLVIAAIIPGETLFVHGGISTKIHNRQDLDSPIEEVEIDILYSDPTTAFPGEAVNSMRGCGVFFGPEVSQLVCERLGVKRIIRGHTHVTGRFRPATDHAGRVLTVITSGVFTSNPYVLVIDPQSPEKMTRMSLTNGTLTDVEIETTEPRPADDTIPVIRAGQLEPEIKQAYDSLATRLRGGTLSAKFRLHHPIGLALTPSESCDLYQLPIHDLIDSPPRPFDQRRLIVEIRKQTRQIHRVFYATQLSPNAVRKIVL